MGKKLTGMLNLSKIPRDLIYKTKNGDKAIFIDIMEKRDGADRFGNTHTICLYDKVNRKNIFLGDMKVQEFGNGGGSAPASAPAGATANDDSDDLPF